MDSFIFVPITDCLNYTDQFFNSNDKLKSFSTIKDAFKFCPISTSDVFDLLNKLNEKSSPGVTGIEGSILKASSTAIAQPITDLFNLCIETNKIPDEWKISFITPVFKGKGSKSQVGNYRPISILPPLAKIFEKLISIQIYDFMSNNGMLHESQFGFRRHLSCELALNTVINSWKLSVDQNKNVLAILLDLSKAFDTVDHSILIAKLKRYSFSTSSLALIKNYLSNRYSITKFKDCFSDKKLNEEGVPQVFLNSGSIFLYNFL